MNRICFKSLLVACLVVRGAGAPATAGLARTGLNPAASVAVPGPDVPPERMKAIYEAVKTPYKYGIVIPAPEGKKVDCPTVFRHKDRWYMVYVQLENDPQGYTTQLAVSDDLLHWQPRGTILARGEGDAWDKANAAGGIALADTQWGGDGTLGTHEGRYWLSYLGGSKPGYETPPLSIGMASRVAGLPCVVGVPPTIRRRDAFGTRGQDALDTQGRDGLATHGNELAPAQAEDVRDTFAGSGTSDVSGMLAGWERLPVPILRPDDKDARPFETDTLFKSFIFRDATATLGAPFVMYYNARPARGDETIGMAISQDLRTWRRYGDGPVIVNPRPADLKHGVISGDPQVVRMGDLWVMFYFGAFWKPKAFDTFAASRDLVHWTRWDGPHLIEPSEPWDNEFAHKPWVLKHNGVVYHFYCAVGNQGRAIALATSRPMKEHASAVDPDPAYMRAITGRADKIAKTLEIADADKRVRVRDIIVQQYRDLNAIHTQRDREIEAAKATMDEAGTKSLREQADSRVRQLHRSYLTKLSAELTPEQVDRVKDGMTYGVLPATYRAYLAQVPELTEIQKQQIMTYLVEARELAMDGGTSEEKHAVFRQYKGKINNYLSAQGYKLK